MRCLCLMILIGAASLAHAQEKDEFARWEKDIARFEQQDRESPKAPGGVVFIGSSSIRMWDLEKSFPDMKAVNRGFGGSQVVDSNHFADRILLPLKPRLVVLYAGDNDIGKGKTPERVFEDWKAFVATVQGELPKTRILFIAIKPSLKRWNLIENVRAANALIAEHCATDERLSFVDIDTPMIGDDGKPRGELFKDDGLHLNDKGYEVWKKEIIKILKN